MPLQEEDGSDNEEDACANLPVADDAEVPDMPQLMEMPSLETYKKKWAEKLAHHARACKGKFSKDNLIPTPVPQLRMERLPVRLL